MKTSLAVGAVVVGAVVGAVGGTSFDSPRLHILD